MTTSQDFHGILTLKNGYIEKLKELEVETKKLPALYKDAAEKESLYRQAKAKAYLALLAENQKVTVIPALVNGKTAEFRLVFKISEGILKSSKENIKRIHSNIEAYRSLISMAKSEINIR
jgi:outer membrane lipopolysaccharide assembly protein LptE/RlpB